MAWAPTSSHPARDSHTPHSPKTGSTFLQPSSNNSVIPAGEGGRISLSCGFNVLHLLPLFSSLQEWGCLALPPRLLSTVEIFIAGRKQIGEPRGIRSLVIPLGYYFPG